MKILKRTAHFGDLEIAANPLNTQDQISFLQDPDNNLKIVFARRQS